MKMKKFLALIGTLFLLNISGIAAQQADENEYAYGTVVNITDSEIVLKEYNYEKEEFVEMNYKIAADVKVRNTDSLKAITPGNQVEILYSEKEGLKQALVVVLEKNEGVAEGPDADEEPENANPEQPAQPQAPKPQAMPVKAAEAKAPEAPKPAETAAPAPVAQPVPPAAPEPVKTETAAPAATSTPAAPAGPATPAPAAPAEPAKTN